MILGVLGEYVGRTFLSANGKPQGTVRVDRAQRGRPERTDAVTIYWLALVAAIVTSIAGQVLLKAGAGRGRFHHPAVRLAHA